MTVSKILLAQNIAMKIKSIPSILTIKRPMIMNTKVGGMKDTRKGKAQDSEKRQQRRKYK
jgi:hypothetical protein